MHEYILAGFVAIYDTISVLDVKPFNGPNHTLIFIPIFSNVFLLCPLSLLLAQRSELMLQLINLFARVVVLRIEPDDLLDALFRVRFLYLSLVIGKVKLSFQD